MRPLGKLIVLILIAGIAVGAWRWWQSKAAPGVMGSSSSSPLSSIPDGGNSGGNNSGSGMTEIEILTTGTKKDWLTDEIDQFNTQHQGQWHATLKLVESREAMQAILYSKDQPTVWSPSSPVWIARLGDVWAGQNSGAHILDMDDPASYRVILKSPLVFVTTRSKAAFFKPILSGPNCWAAVRDLSMGRRHTPWGSFKFSHADPLNASSGMLTMSLVLTEFGQQSGQAGSLAEAAGSPGFKTYLGQVERGFYYDWAALGSSALEKAFVSNPSSRDFITAYESAALAAVAANPNLTVIYPNPTAVADQAAVVLNAPWVSPAQHDAGQAFLKLLGSPEALQDGLKYHFRPAQSSSQLSLASQLSENAAHGFQQNYSAIELPPYDALNEAASQWSGLSIAHQQ